MDRAPFMVLGNDVLMDIATEPPATLIALTHRKGVTERVVERYGRAIMAAVEQGADVPKEEWPRLERPKRWARDPDYEERFKRLRRVRDRLTEEHDLRPGIVASNNQLSEMARTLPGDLAALAVLPGMRRYQVVHFGEQLLSAL